MKYRIIILLLLLPFAAMSQDNSMRQTYLQAEEEYRIGHFDDAIELLSKNINGFDDAEVVSAYRLLALCYLEKDNMEKVEENVNLLLDKAPYYSATIADSPRFTDILERIKKGSAVTITTASQQAETLNEVPVPVTLITEEMIERSGARNLKEVLLAYVPGMNNVESNEELNISMRGLYSGSQNKILIMLDGHRLNSYSTNTVAPDFSISLEKVKQIEILRGPASSVYGDVALTAVVNIITKSPYDVDGIVVRGGMGNHGVLQGDFLLGKRYLDIGVMAWGSLYNADGEEADVPIEKQFGIMPQDLDITIGGFNQRPSHDYGIKLQLGNFNILYNNRFSKTVAPYSMSYFCAPYSYDKYRKLNGNAPGYAKDSHHAEVSWQKSWENFMLKGTVNYDMEVQNYYLVAGDTIPDVGFNWIYPTGTNDSLFLTKALFQNLEWNEQTIGVHLQAAYNYAWKEHKGTISGGLQLSRFSLDDSYYYEGGDFDKIYVTYNDQKALFTGKETSANVHLQLKHQWRNFIMNLGLRYDYKYRFNKQKIHEWSPRIAAIYLHPLWEAKFCYARSYVDAPYYFRNNNLDTGVGSPDLKSEYLDSYQLMFSSEKLIKGLDFDVNVFYNHATDFVIPSLLNYINAGKLDNMGVEVSANYNYKRFWSSFNFTWQQVLDSELYSTKNSYVYNIPKITSNLILSYDVWKHLRANVHLNLQSKQYSIIEVLDQTGTPFVIDEPEYPTRVLCNAGLTCHRNNLEVILSAHNLFNKKYDQGGSSVAPIRQRGLWYNLAVSYKF